MRIGCGTRAGSEFKSGFCANKCMSLSFYRDFCETLVPAYHKSNDFYANVWHNRLCMQHAIMELATMTTRIHKCICPMSPAFKKNVTSMLQKYVANRLEMVVERMTDTRGLFYSRLYFRTFTIMACGSMQCHKRLKLSHKCE
jgi:hypothetical protein